MHNNLEKSLYLAAYHKVQAEEQANISFSKCSTSYKLYYMRTVIDQLFNIDTQQILHLVVRHLMYMKVIYEVRGGEAKSSPPSQRSFVTTTATATQTFLFYYLNNASKPIFCDKLTR